MPEQQQKKKMLWSPTCVSMTGFAENGPPFGSFADLDLVAESSRATLYEGQYSRENIIIRQPFAAGSHGTIFHVDFLEVLKNRRYPALCAKQLVGGQRVEGAIVKHLGNHPRLVHVYDVIEDDANSGSHWLVMEKLPAALDTVITPQCSSTSYFPNTESVPLRKPAQPLSLGAVLQIAQHVLEGLAHMHALDVMHRDLKPANILVEECKPGLFNAKICDYGLARSAQPDAQGSMTPQMVTLWYRAPELLAGATNYTTAVDMWSVGCILAEMLLNKPLFPSGEVLEQLHRIFQMKGGPCEENWPGFTQTALFRMLRCPPPIPKDKTALRKLFACQYTAERFVAPEVVDLIESLLEFDPNARPTAVEALQHPAFRLLAEMNPATQRCATVAEIPATDSGAGAAASSSSASSYRPTSSPVGKVRKFELPAFHVGAVTNRKKRRRKF